MQTRKGKFNLSLKFRLLILLVVMILPFISFSTYKAFEINNRLEVEAKDESLRIAEATARTVDEYIISTGDMLIPIAVNKVVQNQDYPAIKAYLDKVVPNYPFYHLIAFVDLQGNVKAVAMSAAMANSEDARKLAKTLSVRDTVCYRRGIATKGIAVGDFMYSKITKMPVVHVTYPVYNPYGKRIGFLAAAFDLTKLQKKIVGPEIPGHIEIGVISDKGVVMVRNREPEKFIGMDVSNQQVFLGMVGKTEGNEKIMMPDGVVRISGFARTKMAPWYVKAGVDVDYIRDQVTSQLANHFAVFIPLLLLTILGWLWMGRDVAKVHTQTEELTLIDPLTSIWNNRKLNQDFSREIERARRYKEELSFLMLDIDYFKPYNDRNGHQVGDKALQKVAVLIVNAVRASDIVYRYGGEELCVLLPQTNLEAAYEIARRIRLDIETTTFEGEETQPEGKLTISIGVATYPYDAISQEMLIKSADKALYRAKENGRNRVEVYRDIMDALNTDSAMG